MSSYGFSGTNVHAIVEQAPERRAAPEDISAESATTAPLLFRAVVHLGRRTAPHRRPAGRLGGRHMTTWRCRIWPTPWRAGARTARYAPPSSPSSLPELTEALREVADGDTPYQAAVGRDDRGPVWVFSGQGSQWAAMGAELLANEPVFAATVAQAEPLIARESGFSVTEAMSAPQIVTGHRPDPADAVHHAGRPGRHHEGIRGAPGRGHRALPR